MPQYQVVFNVGFTVEYIAKLGNTQQSVGDIVESLMRYSVRTSRMVHGTYDSHGTLYARLSSHASRPPLTVEMYTYCTATCHLNEVILLWAFIAFLNKWGLLFFTMSTLFLFSLAKLSQR